MYVTAQAVRTRNYCVLLPVQATHLYMLGASYPYLAASTATELCSQMHSSQVLLLTCCVSGTRAAGRLCAVRCLLHRVASCWRCQCQIDT